MTSFLLRRTAATLLSLLIGGRAVLAEAPPTEPRVRRIDVKHVAIDLRFDWAKKQAHGSTTITFAPLSATRSVNLDAGMLTIHSVTLADGTPLTFAYDGKDSDDGLAIALDRTYPARRDLTVRIAYETNWVNDADPNNLGGSDGKGIRYFAPTSTEPIKRRQIWSGGIPGANRYWFPSSDTPDDLRTTHFKATVPKPLSAISNGVLEGVTINDDGTRTFRWSMKTPYANHLTTFVVGEYTDVQQNFQDIPLRSFGYPEEKEAVAASVVRLPDMMRFFGDLTGVRYPHPSYSQVFVQDHQWGFGGMGMSTLTENMVDDAPTHADYFYLWDGLEAEALASQWFGAHLFARDVSDAWLNRGFAHYLDEMYTEHKNGRAELLLWNRLGDHATYLGDWKSGNRHPVVSHDAVHAADNYPYIRGAMVLHMLRKQLGEEVWAKTLRHYVRSHAGRTVSTDDFRRAVEEASGKPISWFFDQWLHSIGHPVFEISKRYDEQRTELTLTVKQVQRRDSTSTYRQPEYFAGNVDVAIDGDVRSVRLEAHAENVFTFASAKEPLLVSFDREATWIKEMTFAKSVDELLYQMRWDTDVTGVRWAMSELVAVAKKDGTSASDRAKIHAEFRALILSKAYWRLRYTALVQLQGMLAPAVAGAPLTLDDSTTHMLLSSIRTDTAWTRAQAITFLGATRDVRYDDLYIGALRDTSHVVSYAAATALGSSRSPKAYDALVSLMRVPSWKGENRLSGLNGLKELGDQRAVTVAIAALSDQTSPRWTLGISRWDFRIAAADLLAALGRGDAAGTILSDRFERSFAEGDVNDMFSNVLLMVKLTDPHTEAVLAKLRTRFADDANALSAVAEYETQLASVRKKP